MKGRGGCARLVLFGIVCVFVLLVVRSDALRVTGTNVVYPQQGIVEAKFVYDYSLDPMRKPGLFEFKIKASLSDDDLFYLMLFDDQWQSFGEAQSVWDESNCDDKLRASRWAAQIFPEWMASDDGFSMSVNVTEKMRPRYWWVAVASCGPNPVTYTFDFRMINPLRGMQSEFGFDQQGIGIQTFLFCVLYGVLVWRYLDIIKSGETELSHGGRVTLQVLGIVLNGALLGTVLVTLHWVGYSLDGMGLPFVRDGGSFLLICAKGLFMCVLVLLAQGELFTPEFMPLVASCVLNNGGRKGSEGTMQIQNDDLLDTEGINNFDSFDECAGQATYLASGGGDVKYGLGGGTGDSHKWSRSKEGFPGAMIFSALVDWLSVQSVGVKKHQRLALCTVAFCLLSFVLEMWGLHSYRTRLTTNYIYDSIPGFCIVTLDLVFFAHYLDSLVTSYWKEVDRDKRRLYAQWGGLFSLWFFSLPLIVLAGFVVAPWTRATIVNTAVHGLNLIAFYSVIHGVESFHTPTAKQAGYVAA